MLMVSYWVIRPCETSYNIVEMKEKTRAHEKKLSGCLGYNEMQILNFWNNFRFFVEAISAQGMNPDLIQTTWAIVWSSAEKLSVYK